MFMRIPVRLDEKFSYEDVDGDFTLAPVPPARNRFDAGPGGDSTDVDLDNGVEVTVSSGGKRGVPLDSARRDSLERRRYGPGKVTQCRTDSTWTKVEERFEGTLRVAYDMPCNMASLDKSPALPAATASDEELFDLRTDPHQLTNVANRSEYDATRQELRARIERWMRDTADPRVDRNYDAWDKYPYFGGAVVDKDGNPLPKRKDKTKP
jgi:hypothetical protein